MPSTFTLSDQAVQVLQKVIALAPAPRIETDMLIRELNAAGTAQANNGTISVNYGHVTLEP